MKIILCVFTGFIAVLVLWHLPRGTASPPEVRVLGMVPAASANLPESELRLRECSEKVARGRAWLQTVPAYTATFRKQERLGEELHDENTIELKIRHQPFSVMMRWLDEGRVLYYRDGENSNRMTVKMGGWKGRLGWINLDPNSRLALAESRYPVTQVGLMGLIDELLRQWEPYIDRADGVHCQSLGEESVSNRPCQVFRVTYASPEVSTEYRQTTVWLDAEHSVPLRVLNYDWNSVDPDNPHGLIEHYVYEDVDFQAQVADADFRIPDGNAASSQVALQDGGE